MTIQEIIEAWNGCCDGGGSGGGDDSDFSTATVTSINNSIAALRGMMPHIADDPEESSGEAYFDVGTTTITAILYKGKCVIYLPSGVNYITISGNIEDDGDGYYIITGDCTITIMGGEA